MQDKIKYGIFGLTGFVILVVIIFLGLKVRSLERERRDLQRQNVSLNEKIVGMTADNTTLQQKISSLSKDLKDIGARTADVQQKYDLLVKERDDLTVQIDQINKEKTKQDSSAQAPGSVSSPSPVVKSAIDEAYLSSILKQKAHLEVQISMMRETLEALKATNGQLILEKNSLLSEAKNLTSDTQDVLHASEYNKKMADNLAQALVSEKNNNLDLAKRLKAVRDDNRQLRQQIQTIGERKLALDKKVSDIKSKNSSLENSLASMELYVKQQMLQMEDSRGTKSSASSGAVLAQSSYEQEPVRQARQDVIHLPPIVVSPQDQSELSGASDSGEQLRIISIDKDNNFVVVNAGQSYNLKIGDKLHVYRDELNIGTIEVIQTRDRISACDIKKEKTELRVGDLIRS